MPSTADQLVLQLRDQLVGRVWETNHLGGHRFAPTAVLLPFGTVYGRLGRYRGRGLRGSGKGSVRSGRTTFSRPGQAAEAAVRVATADEYLDNIDVVSVDQHPAGWNVVVAHRDGRR